MLIDLDIKDNIDKNNRENNKLLYLIEFLNIALLIFYIN